MPALGVDQKGIEMDRNNYCRMCKYHRSAEKDEWICTNPDSEYFAEYTEHADWCEEWEER